MNGYDHTQHGPWHWLLGGCALTAIAGGVALSGRDPSAVGLAIAGLLFLALAAGFAHLRTYDAGDALRIEFGPLRVFGKSLRYAEIASATPGRTSWIDGWGIHWIPGRGWTWNVMGFACVRVELRSGGTLRIGTDDPDGLAAFLATRIDP